MQTLSSPYLLKEASVQRVMLKVLLALIPGIITHVWFFGPALLVQLLISTGTALAAEAAMLAIRKKPVRLFLSDLSVVVTAWLIAVTFPAIAPWWLIVVGTLFAVVIAKQLYGGLGQNLFNPAMIAFAVCIVSFPALMSQWPAEGQTFSKQISHISGSTAQLDGLTAATPLDTLKTTLKMGEGKVHVAEVLATHPETFGLFAGHGLEWVSLAYLLGGLWLIRVGVITWHIPVAFLAGMGLFASLLWIIQPSGYASPLFHWFAGATMLGAFFIATDPVSGATTPRGKLIFAGLAGILAYIIRVFGGYPDGVAFAVLLLNIAAPLIDHLTQPPIFGMKSRQ